MGIAPQRVTLTDVARASGVSTSTASRALHGGAEVRDELAFRVRAAAEQLGYSVNHQARSLRRGRDEAIGVAVEDFTIPFFGRIVGRVEQAAHERGYGVVITCAGSGRSEVEAVEPLLSRGVAGLVVASGTSGAPHGYLQGVARDLPVVQVDALGPSEVSDAVGIDNAGAGRTLTEHLLAHGHERILFLGSGGAASTVVLRSQGYEAAMAAAGLAPRTAWLGYRPVDAPARAVAALAAATDVTAVISGVARTTMGLMSALKVLGRRRTAVVAVDDFAGADAFEPGLTVLEQDAEEMGARSAALLFERIGGYTGPPRHVQLDLELIVRGSGELSPHTVASPTPSAPQPSDPDRTTAPTP